MIRSFIFICIVMRLARADVISDAVNFLQHGDVERAEQVLHQAIAANPHDSEATGLLAVVLDQQKKYDAAEPYYRQAFALGADSAGMRNNYGNHLLLLKRPALARLQFEKALARDPSNRNARTQLALLQMQADYAMGRKASGTAIRERLCSEAHEDPALLIAIGEALASAREYSEAERVFELATSLKPSNFQSLYQGGLAASRAGHLDHAEDLLNRALALQPDDADVLYDLAATEYRLGKADAAPELLVRAVKITPNRAELHELLARITARLGYFADSAQAWQRYLELAPGDASAQREYAFVQTAIPDFAGQSLLKLKTYVGAHPGDAAGRYELGTAESVSDPEGAVRELSQAVKLKPDFVAARFARGLLEHRLGRTAAALEDFTFAAEKQPKNAAILDRLGQTQFALGHIEEAVRALLQAAHLAADNSTVLFHLGRALAAANRWDEAAPFFARARELGPVQPVPTHAAGLLDYLALSPEEQLARYRAGVERTVKQRPENIDAQLRYLELVLDEGNTEEAASVAHAIAAQNPPPPVLQRAEALLAAARNAEKVPAIRH